MNELFGISMTTIATIMVVLLAFCLLTIIYIFLRRPIVFRIGMRNIPRRPAQTVLVIIGLMLSTLLVTAALGVGDTLDKSVRDTAYDQLGQIDQLLISSSSTTTDQYQGSYFDQSKADEVGQTLTSVPDVDGVMAAVQSQAAAINDATGRANSQVALNGFDPAAIDAFGGFPSVDGGTIDVASFQPNTAVISKDLAKDLALKTGDTFTIYVNSEPTTITVGGITNNGYMVGEINDNTTGETIYSALALPLPEAQQLLGVEGKVNVVLVSLTGPVDKSKDQLDAAESQIAPLLQGSGLGISNAKADFLDAAEGISSAFTGIFIVLGLFSIAAGILLIILIFTMLAAERRPEMGMARAVGQRRLQLIQQFISEGAGYALLAGVVGVVIGIAATWILAAVLGSLVGDAFPIHAHVSGRSLIAAYALGVTITFFTVVIASWRISRLNIVAAVRDIPDEHAAKRRIRTLVWAVILLLIGGLLLLTGISSGNAFAFYTGISLVPFGVAILLVWFGISSRLAFSLVGLWLLVIWLLPDNVFSRIFGEYDGGIEMFFLSGIFLVIGTTLLIVQNTTTLLWIVTKFGSLFKNQLGAIKLAVAYPGNARGRTGLAIAMFSLIIFSLVMIATISQNLTAAFLNDDALAGWNVTAQTNPGQPVDDFTDRVASADLPADSIAQIGTLTSNSGLAVSMQQTAPVQGEPGSYTFYAADQTFVETTNWKFSFRANGYDSDQAVVDALASNQNFAVVDEIAAFGNDFGPPSSLELQGISRGDKTFDPITMQVTNADGNGTTEVTVIGVIDPSRSFLFGMYAAGPDLSAVVGENPTQTYFIKTGSGADSVEVARSIEAIVIKDGVRVRSIQAALEDAQSTSSGFLYMIQGFMGLGLIVGLAAVGVISFRSVVERRQQIGMMRALGFQKNMVSSVFLIETAYIVILGVIAGTATGLALARNLLLSDDAGGSDGLKVEFAPPWPLIIMILVGTVVIALLTAWIPSRQASNISPADALRYE